MKSAILPGWSMLTMFRRICSENRGLPSEIFFISPISERVRARTSSESKLVSSRYSAATTMGFSGAMIFLIRKRFSVEMNTFRPPSGRFTLRMILAAVPTLKSWSPMGFSISGLSVSTSPMNPCSERACSTTWTSPAEATISGVKMPGKIGFPCSGSTNSLSGST